MSWCPLTNHHQDLIEVNLVLMFHHYFYQFSEDPYPKPMVISSFMSTELDFSTFTCAYIAHLEVSFAPLGYNLDTHNVPTSFDTFQHYRGRSNTWIYTHYPSLTLDSHQYFFFHLNAYPSLYNVVKIQHFMSYCTSFFDMLCQSISILLQMNWNSPNFSLIIIFHMYSR